MLHRLRRLLRKGVRGETIKSSFALQVLVSLLALLLATPLWLWFGEEFAVQSTPYTVGLSFILLLGFIYLPWYKLYL